MIVFNEGDYTFINYKAEGSDWVRYWRIAKTQKVSVPPVAFDKVPSYANFNVIVNEDTRKALGWAEQQQAKGGGEVGIIYVGPQGAYIVYDRGLAQKYAATLADYDAFVMLVDENLQPDTLYGENLTPASILPTRCYVDGYARLNGLCPTGVVRLSSTAQISTYAVSPSADSCIAADMVAYHKGRVVGAFGVSRVSCYSMPVPNLASLDEKHLIQLGKELALELDISNSAEFKEDEGYVSLDADEGPKALEAARNYGVIDQAACKVAKRPAVGSALSYEANICAVARTNTLHEADIPKVRSYLYTEAALADALQFSLVDTLLALTDPCTTDLCDLRNGFTTALEYWVKMRAIYLKRIYVIALDAIQREADYVYDIIRRDVNQLLEARINAVYGKQIAGLFDLYSAKRKVPAEVKKVTMSLPSGFFNFQKPDWLRPAEYTEAQAEDLSFLASRVQAFIPRFLINDSSAVTKVGDVDHYDCIFNMASGAGILLKPQDSAEGAKYVYSTSGTFIDIEREEFSDIYVNRHHLEVGEQDIVANDALSYHVKWTGNPSETVVEAVSVAANGSILKAAQELRFASEGICLSDRARTLEVITQVVDQLAQPFRNSLETMAVTNWKSRMNDIFSDWKNATVSYLVFWSKDSFKGVNPQMQLDGITVAVDPSGSRAGLRYLFEVYGYDKQINKWGTARDGARGIKNKVGQLFSSVGISNCTDYVENISKWSDCSKTVCYVLAAMNLIGTAALAFAVVGPWGWAAYGVMAAALCLVSIFLCLFGKYKYSKGPGWVPVSVQDRSNGHTLEKSPKLLPVAPAPCWETESAVQAYLTRMRHQADNMAMMYILPILQSMEEDSATMFALVRFPNGSVVNARTAAQVGTIDVYLLKQLKEAMTTQLADADQHVRERFNDFVGGISEIIAAAETIKPLYYLNQIALTGAAQVSDKRGADLTVTFGNMI